MKQIKTTISKAIIFMVVTYCILIGVFAVYFNYLYATKHGFWSWFLFGEIVATFKALVWPYFIF